jgi:hypothetical protein
LWIVPAQVEGAWRLAQGELTLKQEAQMISGTLSSGGDVTPIANGRLRGDQVGFTAGGVEYSGRVSGDRMEGAVKPGTATTAWSAVRIRQ